VRQQAEATLASLAQLQVSDADQANLRNRRSEAQRDLMWAAFHLSDYAAARSALDQSGFRADPAPRESDSTQDRFTNAGRQLTRVHVLYRAGEIDEAHRVLAALWPEVEVVFAAAPRELFNQVQMARALSIKAEVEIMDDASRRALEQRAATGGLSQAGRSRGQTCPLRTGSPAGRRRNRSGRPRAHRCAGWLRDTIGDHGAEALGDPQSYGRPLDRFCEPAESHRMEILTVTEAQPKMGRLIDRVLRGAPVIIRKGNRLVQLTEFVVPDPIPERPVGYFQRRPADYAMANSAIADAGPVR
jgi:hypothetical protein